MTVELTKYCVKNMEHVVDLTGLLIIIIPNSADLVTMITLSSPTASEMRSVNRYDFFERTPGERVKGSPAA